MFDVPLMGEGTGSVEALPSYLHRCAYHHAVPTTKFLEYLHSEHLKLHRQYPRPVKASQTVVMGSLLTYGHYPTIFVDTIERLTGRNILPTTFLPLKHVVTQPQVEVNRNSRWCPECFSAIRDIGEEPHIKLIWHLSEVTHCPHHGTSLLEACPHCGEAQNAIGRTVPLDVCHKCHESLRERATQASVIQPSWLHQAGDLLRLLTHLAHRKEPNFFSGRCINSDGLAKSLRDFSLRCTEREFDQAYEYCWTNRDIRKQIWGSEKISLRTLRTVAHLTNVDIFDLLTGNLVNKTKAMRFLWRQSLPDPLAAFQKRNRHDHDKNFRVLNELTQQEPPLPLKEIARRADLSIGYIDYRFPVLKQKIVNRHSKHLELLSLEKHHRATQAAMSYFCTEKYAPYQKSRKQALKHLLEDTDLTKMYLKPAINGAYQSYQQP